VRPVFAEIGRALNDLDGQVKLTADFGRFATLSDMLHEFPHVLGVRCDAGGCGGRTSFATTGEYDGVRFEEASPGYPRGWRRRTAGPNPIRRIL
jgi:hypothetical protein